MTSRLEQLLQHLQDEPKDPFNLYTVALEYLKLNSEKAESFFATLVSEHPQYLPTYYTYGKFSQSKKKYDEAKTLYEKGIVVAQAASDQKAVAELRNALSELEFEME